MKALLSGLMAAAIAALSAIPLPVTANAAPFHVPKPGTQEARPEVEQVQYWRRAHRRNLWRDGYYGRGYYGDRYYNRRYYGDGYYRGYGAYRPYRHYRPYGYYRPRGYYRPYYYQPPGLTLWFSF